MLMLFAPIIPVEEPYKKILTAKWSQSARQEPFDVEKDLLYRIVYKSIAELLSGSARARLGLKIRTLPW
ncbi:MAG: hypothetical protein PVF96_07140 [Candidatus Bathyarchaeota archaeon]